MDIQKWSGNPRKNEKTPQRDFYTQKNGYLKKLAVGLAVRFKNLNQIGVYRSTNTSEQPN